MNGQKVNRIKAYDKFGKSLSEALIRHLSIDFCVLNVCYEHSKNACLPTLFQQATA